MPSTKFSNTTPNFDDLALMLELDLWLGNKADFRRRLRHALKNAAKIPVSQKKRAV